MIWPGDLSVTCCALFTTFLDRLATTTFDVDVRGGDASHTEEWAALGEIERHMEPEGESPTAHGRLGWKPGVRCNSGIPVSGFAYRHQHARNARVPEAPSRKEATHAS
jgi:hypothetical protein